MAPRLEPGCTVLIDRHHNAVAPYRRGDHTLYAVADGTETVVRYVESHADLLTLHAEARRAPCKVLYVPPGKQSHDLIVGRIAHVSMEI
jgi:hypothetical protein